MRGAADQLADRSQFFRLHELRLQPLEIVDGFLRGAQQLEPLRVHQFVAQKSKKAKRQDRAKRDQNAELMHGHGRLADFQTPKADQWERKQAASRQARRPDRFLRRVIFGRRFRRRPRVNSVLPRLDSGTPRFPPFLSRERKPAGANRTDCPSNNRFDRPPSSTSQEPHHVNGLRRPQDAHTFSATRPWLAWRAGRRRRQTQDFLEVEMMLKAWT